MFQTVLDIVPKAEGYITPTFITSFLYIWKIYRLRNLEPLEESKER